MVMDFGEPGYSLPQAELLHRPFRLGTGVIPRRSESKCLLDYSGQGVAGRDATIAAPGCWPCDFHQLPFKPELRQKIMLDNVRKLFGLSA